MCFTIFIRFVLRERMVPESKGVQRIVMVFLRRLRNFGDILTNAVYRYQCELFCISLRLSKYCFAAGHHRKSNMLCTEYVTLMLIQFQIAYISPFASRQVVNSYLTIR